MKGIRRVLTVGRIAGISLVLTALAAGCGDSSNSTQEVSQKSVQSNQSNSDAWQKAKSDYKVPKKAPR